jgi:cell fate regulator YaaT (PSP1 superfamily)
VVARSPRGLELATILRPIDGEAAQLLEGQPGGQILRVATPDDESLAARLRERAALIFEDARSQAAKQHLTIDILDAEILLDAKQAILHFVAASRCDPRPLMDALSDRFRLLITLHDLAPKPAGGSCGSGGCGSDGGCGSCGSGGCGSCESHEHSETDAHRVSLV